MKRLTKEQVMLLHKELVKESGGSAEIRDEGLLDSALNAPFQIISDNHRKSSSSWIQFDKKSCVCRWK